MHFWKLINNFHKKYPKKSIATSLSLDFVLPIARSLISKELKQKYGHLSKRANKKSRN